MNIGEAATFLGNGDEDDDCLNPKEQVPPEWTESIDWRIPRSLEVRKRFHQILSDPEYKRTDQWLDDIFQKQKQRVITLRKKKQRKYAGKNASRRPHSSQFDRVSKILLMHLQDAQSSI